MPAPYGRATKWIRPSGLGGRVTQRLIEVGQSVREGDVLAVLDDTDYRLAEEAAHQQLFAAKAKAQQAESGRSTHVASAL